MKKLLILFILSGCNLIDPPTHVSEELQPYVDIVVNEYNKRGVYVPPIKVVFGEINDDGVYSPSPYWDKKIIIDRDFYDLYSDYFDSEIIQVVAHEFGHYMGRNHNNKGENCSPESLMCKGCCLGNWEENWNYYFDELVYGK